MTDPHLLNLGNARKVLRELSGVLDQTSLSAIEGEIQKNCRNLLTLANFHYRFAIKQTPYYWRQKVSRLYYAGYHASCAVRLYVSGEFSTDVKDHKKFENLPSDFPSQDRYSNQLSILRSDRNTSDYDHLARAQSLVLPTREAEALIESFLEDTNRYLDSKGMVL